MALGVAVLAAVTMAQIGAHSAHPTVALLLVALAGAGLGFLPFNLPPASMYTGDSGAYVLGFIIGTLSIRAATGPTNEVFIAVPLVALGFPLMDLGLATIGRSLEHRHPMIGDADHITTVWNAQAPGRAASSSSRTRSRCCSRPAHHHPLHQQHLVELLCSWL